METSTGKNFSITLINKKTNQHVKQTFDWIGTWGQVPRPTEEGHEFRSTSAISEPLSQ